MSDYTKGLNLFLQHLKDSANEMLDIVSDGKDYEDRFDIKLGINGKHIILPLCADNYERLVKFIEDEIKEEEEIGG
jgi:hypothetical protein